MNVGVVLLWAVVALAGAAGVLAPWAGAGRLLAGAATAATAALIRLGWAFAGRDWTFTYVADNTRSEVGPLLRVAGLWAGPEGSLLLWTTMAAWAAVLAACLVERRAAVLVPPAGGPMVDQTAGSGAEGSAGWPGAEGSAGWPGPEVIVARRLGAGLVAAYGLVLAVAAPPFDQLAVPPVDGLGLQPVLEYPAMVWHPPLLYAGLLGLLVPALVAGASAATGQLVVPSRRLLGLPLALLTAGLLTGALWANVELGWGGYWAWDPIEAAGLVAWCCGAAALHAGGNGGGAGGDAGRRTAVVGSAPVAAALGLAPGLAAVWATTLTRVGLVSSVHAFADIPALRVGLLVVAGLASAVVAGLVTAASRRAGTGPRMGASGPAARAAPVAPGGSSRRGLRSSAAGHAVGEGAVPADGAGSHVVGEGGGTAMGRAGLVRRQAAVTVLAAAALFVAVGAYEPLIEAATTGDSVAIAGHFYSRLLWPLAVAGVGLALWSDRRWWPALAGAAAAGLTAPDGTGSYGLVLAAAGGALAASALGTLLPPGAPSFRPGPSPAAARSGGIGPYRPGPSPAAEQIDGAGSNPVPSDTAPGRARRSGLVAHVGAGLFLIGVAGTTAGRVDVVDAPVGVAVDAGGVMLEHRTLELIDRSATREAVATVLVDGVELRPRLVAYGLRGVSTSEVASRFRGLDEVQVLLVDGDRAAARYQVNQLPRVGLVWLGGLVTALGLAGRRSRTRATASGRREGGRDRVSTAAGRSPRR